jgi:uncharacterized protein YutE (UPF0331/DUF86 family)
LSKWVKFRNIVAHEYLDIKWGSIRKFIKGANTLYKNFLNTAKQYLEKKIEEESEQEEKK